MPSSKLLLILMNAIIQYGVWNLCHMAALKLLSYNRTLLDGKYVSSSTLLKSHLWGMVPLSPKRNSFNSINLCVDVSYLPVLNRGKKLISCGTKIGEDDLGAKKMYFIH